MTVVRFLNSKFNSAGGLQIRRVVIQLKQPTRHGDRRVALLTNLPTADADVLMVADLYLERWQIEMMFQMITDTFHCELDTLGYPRAALFVFCIALVAFNILSTVKAALKQTHGAVVID
jgi:IS4 transposase